jgi:serine/threonine protein kinase
MTYAIESPHSFCFPPNTALRTPEMAPLISCHPPQSELSGFKWSKGVAKKMADQIHSQVRDMLRQSRLVRQAEGIELVRRGDIFEVNQILGSGAFSEVTAVTLRDGRRFACKNLKQKLMSQPDNFRLAAAEMACEAHMLASFDHPHILKIRGWAYNGIASFEEGYHNSFFLLLDQLDETLDNRITRWQAEEEQRQRIILTTPSVGYDEHYHQNIYVEKLRILLGIGSALEYLHERGVIFRDLKPNNIGFFNGNQVQLFDFGLSRELPQLNTNQKFEMSGKVGTLRYM